ncbi:uncharacterized protein E0L32_001018 [Thyridium curvatum]|uniref:Myb-like domain-containing protein n=1 Tax=Thyridium curvatum TaxID=1093900 RepID=A0A507B3M5_9PEZI|nr:uncharacterized protein E0L32_001018 [Thyridium curvatum]TPX11200.1 hypothetical protein E0L32_001018 [Thyridium curvatum]
MLLPSAISCDSAQSPPPTRFQSALFASPPASPPQLSTQNAIGNIFTTCRSLQALLASPPLSHSMATRATTPPPSSGAPAPLPTPPMSHAPSPPPLKLRLRSRRVEAANAPAQQTSEHPVLARKRIVKRSHQPPAAGAAAPAPRGPNKRRRSLEDDGAESDVDEESTPAHGLGLEEAARNTTEDAPPPARPQTPKRARIAPEVIPLGLERGDFHSLHPDGVPDGSSARGTDVEVEADGQVWSTEEDRMLVELVLEKLKLTKTDWQDCARSLGKDRHSLGRRWKSLMLQGDIGLKGSRSSRRSKIHGTWR